MKIENRNIRNPNEQNGYIQDTFNVGKVFFTFEWSGRIPYSNSAFLVGYAIKGKKFATNRQSLLTKRDTILKIEDWKMDFAKKAIEKIA